MSEWRKENSLAPVNENANWYSHHRKKYGSSSKNELPLSLVISLLGIGLNKIEFLTEKDILTSILIPTLLILAKI